MEKKNIEVIVSEKLNALIEITIKKCLEWLQKSNQGFLEFVDPIEKTEISAHYGATHLAASLILLGNKKQGIELLDSIISRWKRSTALPGFHNDFNNFALCVIWPYIENGYRNVIQNVILDTPDSNHDTVNWLPMRWAVNDFRFQWTQDNIYLKKENICRDKIRQATWNDGFIDDRLPKGTSFNLQYNVSTVAGLQYVRGLGKDITLDKELGALLAAIAPDGDINYLGRGVNQVFAWGPWIYLLTSSGQLQFALQAIAYLEEHLPLMLQNHNIMLNSWQGEEKYMWWDYHYCSVYTAHLLMWLCLAKLQINALPIEPMQYEQGDSGMKIFRADNSFAVTFSGRKEYLAEKGPALYALWTKSMGMISKGCFGPWLGAFGNRYCIAGVTLRNYFGVLQVVRNSGIQERTFLNKIISRYGIDIPATEKIIPAFLDVECAVRDGTFELFWQSKKKITAFFSAPLLCDKKKMTLLVDGNEVPLYETGRIKNQYSWCRLIQSNVVKGKKWNLLIQEVATYDPKERTHSDTFPDN